MPEKWQSVMDILVLECLTVNDAISEAHCFLSYVTIEDAVEA